MKLFIKSRRSTLLIIFLLIGVYFIPNSTSELTYQNIQAPLSIDEGQILYAPMWSTTTYLRESSGTLIHTWPSSFFPGVAVWWLGNGTILRTIRTGDGGFTAGAGGGVQKVLSNGTVVWDFRYNTNGHLTHHDVKTLPNGNVLLIAWETKTRDEAIAAGRKPIYVNSNGIWPDHIIEVKPTGPSSGTIVWEWHVWDHLIQDYDFSKAHYGIVKNHPELVDVNYVSSTQTDWMHTNSIDYNEKFDQILISVHNFNEIWVIDHSTTTAQAAGHTGGHSGKGGDLLYRWGNPQTYRKGTSSNQKLSGQHDASWIDIGCPGEGNILVFNNGINRLYSTVDEIVPPVDDKGVYHRTPGYAYGPTGLTWTYNPTPTFYSTTVSGAQRLPSGNTIICNGETGEIFEVTPEGSTVWQYNSGVEIFKVVYIPSEEPPVPPEPDVPDLDCSGSLSWTDVEPGATVTGSFQVQNIGGVNSSLNWTINISSITWGTWTFTPEYGENLTPDEEPVTVQVSVVAPQEKNSEFQGYLLVVNQDNATDYTNIPVYLKTSMSIDLNILVHQLIYSILERFPHAFPILRHLMGY
jgi:Arylsulfotransferase (ASST)